MVEPHGDLGRRSPFQLLSGLFLPLDVMRRWHTMATADSWLQDLLEACSNVLVPRPQGMCLSCRERQAVVSQKSRHKFSNRQNAGRRSKEYRDTRHLCECLCNPDQNCNEDSSWREERSDQRQKSGLSSIQQLKNSLKKDLETHQLYLHTIETRLSGLERRTQDVTRNLERANLELEAIKQGSVHLKTLVDEQISSPVTEDLEDLEESLWERWQWSGLSGRSVHPVHSTPKLCRKNDLGCSYASECPEGGSRVHQRSELQTCKHHVDVLIQQITQQIHQMENKIRFTSKLYQRVG
ncbi:uncharacterized protein [Eleutherodactylus coqui]|uniref:uncharacterized protein isoform X2 n=1 Tax=Eleutherodactylus coqui TaxID=57060 RepID=UPI003462C864